MDVATANPQSPLPAPLRVAESWTSIWARRAISIPLYTLLTALYVLGAPLWLLAVALADLLAGQYQTWPRTRALGFFGLYLTCEVAGVAVATAVWTATLGGRFGGPERYLQANATLQRWWTAALFHGTVWLFSIRVQVEGLELAKAGPLLLFVRHAASSDTVLAAALVANPNRLLLRYVLKRELLWDPCLDIVGRRLPNSFVDRNSPRRRGELDAIAQLGHGLDARSAVLIYPEGTRFSAKKLASGLDALRTRKEDRLLAIAAQFSHVLPPKPGGALALLQAAPQADVVFLEHAGLEGAATFDRFWRGGLIGQTLRVRLRRFEAASIPAQDRDLWLFERWAELDAWIGQSAVHQDKTP
jgi:1-acyl-sn-glycerol-3-phosphate acyltransferase